MIYDARFRNEFRLIVPMLFPLFAATSALASLKIKFPAPSAVEPDVCARGRRIREVSRTWLDPEDFWVASP